MLLKYCLSYVVFIYSCTFAQECASDAWGDLNGGLHNDADPSYKSFLVIDNSVTCAGKITNWRFQANVASPCHSVILQVYRPVSGTYQLVGENTYHPTCPRTVSVIDMVSVHEAFTIPVQPDDLIGWTDTGSGNGATSRMFEYSQGLPGSNLFQTVRILDSSCREAHSVCDWDQYATQEGRKYSLRADLQPGDDPFIDNLPGSTEVAEHQPAGIEIYQVEGSNDRNYNDIVHANFTYSLVNGDPNFEIDPITGVIFTVTELDHENIHTHTLNVRVAQGPYTTDDVLTVTVVDINEPHTLDPLSDVRIDAVTTSVGDVIYSSITVSDLDDPNSWPDKTFLLVNTDPAADIFAIVPTGTTGNSASLQLAQSLVEWEGPDVIDVYISATDYYYTTAPEKMTVTIYNMWQPPTVDNLPNAVTLREDTVLNSHVFTVTGSKDPVRGTLNFTIVAVFPIQAALPEANPFNIDVSSGTVRYIGNPSFDFTTVRRYEVEIQVNDGKFYSVPENLTVDITWVNQPPGFDNTAYTSSVPELSPVGTILPGVVLQVTDRDIPLGDWLDYTLSGVGAHLFRASNITNTVFVSGELLCDPGQSNKVYTLQVTVTDSYGETDSRSLTITVTDINNHVPYFEDAYYEGTVSEISRGGTSVLPITASDEDAGENADMSFVVLEEDARVYFEVIPYCSGSCTKELQMKQPISHIDYHNITFTLVVFDHGFPSLNSTTTVYVEVIDENNHPPEFVQEYYNLETRTDLEDMAEVARVEVDDPDTVVNSNVSFLLLIPTQGFMIEDTTGVIKNKYGLKAYKTHIFYVYARDWAKPEFYSNPAIVRIDTYTPQHHLVDIHMEIPLTDFIEVKEEFLRKLNEHISPWYAKEENKLLDPYQSILTIYALEEKPPESADYLDHSKTFVSRNSLLGRLRVNIPGKPQEWLRDEDFAEYQVFKVLPTYPVWLIDTIGGIVTLTLLCLLFLLLWVAIFYAIFRGCKKSKNKVAPVVRYPAVEEYALKYGDYAHVHYTEDINTGKKKGVLKTPLMPVVVSDKSSKKTTTTASKQKEKPAVEEVTSPPEDLVSELPPVISTTGTSAFSNKPLPPSGQTRIL